MDKKLKPVLLKQVLPTCIAIAMAISGGFGIGYVTSSAVEKEKKQHSCIGYTVLDSARVILCTGDTINYCWNKSIKVQK